jgi:hypothetical protein
MASMLPQRAGRREAQSCDACRIPALPAPGRRAATAHGVASIHCHDRKRTMTVIAGIPRLERLMREAASLDIDKSDLRRHEEFVNRKIHDLLQRGCAIAKANGRDVVLPCDVPITGGLQECIHQFRALDQDAQTRPILDQISKLPPLELDFSEEVTASLPDLAGGLSVALARSFKIIDPDLKNPGTAEWDRSFALFDLLI